MAENASFTNPLYKIFGELNAPWCEAVKHAAAQYLDNSEKWAHQSLKWSEKATEWAKSTPLAPVFEAQRLIAKQAVDMSLDIARRWWRLEEKLEEKMEETPGKKE
ncbi:MAG TPA: hypothetical protein VNN62_22985 [Methylomirabilota bacterium]|jgi:hypothetical protein|nr:hypothetical protein [Methylomirabilota bacterium]